jgi:hypothetical protein
VRAALWLQSRDIVHLGGRRLLGPSLVAAYLGVGGLLVLGGLVVHGQYHRLPLVELFTPIWLLWAVLPAVGAGGGSLDAATSLAPYPTGPAMQLTASWAAGLVDIQYVLPLPVLFAAAAADVGVTGLIGAVAFVAGASALGQLAGWLSVAGVRAGRGQSLAITGLAVLCLGLLAVSHRSDAAGTRRLGAIPPTRWLAAGSHAAARGEWAAAVGWWGLLASPVLLLGAVGPGLVRRATVARLAGSVSRATTRSFGPSPAGALAAAAWRGIVRTLSWRAALLAVVAIPFLTALLAHPLTARTLASVGLVSAGATLAANTWSFEAGGTALLLSAPLRRRTVVLVRSAVLAAALTVTLAVAAVSALVSAPLRVAPADLGYAACVLVVVTVAGMRTSISSATAADVDSLRARPASLTAVLTFGGRCLLGCLLLSAGWSLGVLGVLTAAVGTIGYAAWALRGTHRRLTDGATLLAAFATVR